MMSRISSIALFLVLILTGSACAQSTTGAPVRKGLLTTPDGARLYYRVYGTGTPVVIIPGALFVERDLARFGKGRTVIVYDMRNRGRSGAITDSTLVSIGHDVEDLETVRRELGAERVTLVGWSYLGMMVMRYAARYPDRIHRIIQIGPTPRQLGTRYPDSLMAHDPLPVPDPAAVAALAKLKSDGTIAREPRAYCDADFRLQQARLVALPALMDRVPATCMYDREWPVNLERHFYWLFSSTFRDPAPAWDRFQLLSIPVLTIHGTQDRNAPYGGGREWASHLPDGRLLTVRGAAHLPWLESPEIVFPAIESFLSGAWPDGATKVE